jgi:exodeoxyribonuclease VII large subunit
MPAMHARDIERRIYSVSELAGAARFTLEEHFALVWVEGEVSNLRMPGSGHWYFTLKDANAQLRCAMFANRNRTLRFRPRDGMQVVLRGRASLYEPRGDFQLLADHLEPSGEGALRIAFDALKQQLSAEGLFALDRKRALPRYPKHLVVISSRHGAALRDVIAVLRRRCPLLHVTLLDVAVQGNDAISQLLAAFERVAHWPHDDRRPRPDVVLLTRGGGSLEDLWSFNLDSVARAIAACPLPVVSAIGHETDFTISDFVADLRAPTPSAGAELIAPDMLDWQRRAAALTRALGAHWRQGVRQRRAQLALVRQRLTHPGRVLQRQMQQLDEFERRLIGLARQRLARARHALAIQHAELRACHPGRAIGLFGRRLAEHDRALQRSALHRLERAGHAIAALGRALHAVSPLATLGRGYAIVTAPTPAGSRWGSPITSVAQTRPGAAVDAHLDDGRLLCIIEDIQPRD